MTRHYIRMLRFLEPYARDHGASAEDWRAELIEDVVDSGAVCIVPFDVTAQGERHALVGTRFSLIVGSELSSDDTLFVSRIESADRTAGKIPARLKVALEFDEFDRFGPRLDPVQDMFDASNARRTDEAALTHNPLREQLAGHFPAPQDVDRDVDLPDIKWPNRRTLELLDSLQPALLLPPSEPVLAGDEAFARAADIWQRLRLERELRSGLSNRHQLILRGGIRRPVMSDAKRAYLFSRFELPVVEAMSARSDSTAEDFTGLLTSIRLLPLRRDFWWCLWTAWLSRRPASEFRVELYELHRRGLLAELGASEVGSLLLLAAARAADDPIVATLLEDEDGWSAFTDWLSQLEFAVPKPVADDDATTSPPRQSVDSEPEPGELSDDFHRWVLSLRIAGPEVLAEAPERLQTTLTAAAGQLRPIENLIDLHTLLKAADDARAALREVAGVLPSIDELRADAAEAQDVWHALEAVVGHSASRLLARNITPVDLNDALEAAVEPEVEALPPWVWYRLSNLGDEETIEFARLHVLSRPQSRTAADDCVRVVRKHGANEIVVSHLSTCPAAPPDFEGGAARWIDVWLEQADAASAAQREIKEICGGEDLDLTNLSAEDLVEIIGPLNELAALCHQDLVVGCFSASTTPLTGENTTSSVPQVLSRYVSAARALHATLGSLDGMNPQQLDNWLANNKAPVEPASVEVRLAKRLFGPNSAHPELAIATDPQQTWGRIAVPLEVIASRPRDLSFDIRHVVHSEHQKAWPSDWPRTDDPQTFELRAQDWSKKSGQPNEYRATVSVVVLSRQVDKPLRIEFTPLDTQTSDVLGGNVTLKWPRVAVGQRPLHLSWPKQDDTARIVIEHPIGPQRNVADILNRIERRESFAVVAPRRFGKSTLVDHIFKTAPSISPTVAVARPVQCTSCVANGRVDRDLIWRAVIDSLAEALGVTAPVVTGGIFDSSPLQFLRRAAKERKFETCLLLIDEAQLLFPVEGGTALGDKFKDRVESDWSHATDDEAGVVFGLIGLPSLTSRAGTNAMGMLYPNESSREMDEHVLNQLILAVTERRLLTTTRARRRLAEIAGNLFLLRTLLEQLLEHLRTERRSWATLRDVELAESRLIDLLERGQGENVGNWLRDALNDSESINVWKPATTYPIAAALARESEATGIRHQSSQAVVARLNTWLEELSARTPESRFNYVRSRVESRLDALNEIGVLNVRPSDGELEPLYALRSPLVEAWLLGSVKDGYPLARPDECAALVDGTVRHIRRPQGLDRVRGSGGSVIALYQFLRDSGSTSAPYYCAWREVQLEDEAARRRFHDQVRFLERIQLAQQQQEEGASQFFGIEEVGLVDDDTDRAVHVYRWINGFPLSERKGQLTAQASLDLLLRLAEALRLVHSWGAIHRDVRPQNVMFDEDRMRPVLIDFGLAKLHQTDSSTALASGRFVAPEVTSSEPSWTPAADVFALSATIAAVLDSSAAGADQLNELLVAARAADPAQRCSLETLIASAEDLARTLQLIEVRDGAMKAWDASLPRNVASSLKLVRSRFVDAGVQVSLGMYSEPFERCVVVADLLNQALEASGTKSNPLSLGKLKNQVKGADFEAVRYAHRLRGYRSHGSDRLGGEFRNAPPERCLGWIRQTAKLVDSKVDQPWLVDASERLLEGGVA